MELATTKDIQDYFLQATHKYLSEDLTQVNAETDDEADYGWRPLTDYEAELLASF